MMKALTLAIASAAILATAIPQASAQRYRDQDRYIERYCDGRGSDRDCRDWRDNRRSWDRDRYDRWYHSHRHEFGPDDAAAAICGFAAGAAAGAITGSINGATNSSHVARCEEAYRSYDPVTDTYMSRDGYRKQCRL